MLGVAFTVGVLLALVGGTDAHHCVAPHKRVTEMLQRLEESVGENEPPNPSVLLAMNLAGDTASNAQKLLLHQIKVVAVESAQKDMTSGNVALYVLALLSSCQNPRHVQAQGHTVDLVRILQQKTDEEITKLEVDGVPKTTLFSVSLDTIALCLTQAGGYQEASVALARQVLSLESQLSVDTRAVAALALACTYGHTDLNDVQDLLWLALSTVTNGFLDEQELRDGMIGNIYSMGLALQALASTSKFYDPRDWDCEQAFSVVYNHDYHLPMAIAQVLPALVGKSYLDAASLDCSVDVALSPTLESSTSPNLDTTNFPKEATIEVHYSVINTLQGQHFRYTIAVRVPEGSNLLKVLQVAEEKEPDKFSFQTEQTSWGPMVVSIHKLAANTNDRTYWQFLSSGEPLQEGVGTYKPHDGEHIEAVFSTY